MSSNRKLWKVISLSVTRGNRISKSMSYGDCLEKYNEYRKELVDKDTLYMIQVLEVATGAASMSATEEVQIEAPTGFAFDNVRSIA